MKRNLFTIVLVALSFFNSHAQCGNTNVNFAKPTSIGIVIYSGDVETIWNAFRLANYSKNQSDTVSIFLLGKGVELDNLILKDGNLKEEVSAFTNSGGVILACGTCLKSRNNSDPKVCKFSSMKDLYELIRKNSIVLTF